MTTTSDLNLRMKKGKSFNRGFSFHVIESDSQFIKNVEKESINQNVCQ